MNIVNIFSINQLIIVNCPVAAAIPELVENVTNTFDIIAVVTIEITSIINPMKKKIGCDGYRKPSIIDPAPNANAISKNDQLKVLTASTALTVVLFAAGDVADKLGDIPSKIVAVTRTTIPITKRIIGM